MKNYRNGVFASLFLLAVMLGVATARAWEPTAGEVDAVVKSGDFAAYEANLAAWLGQKVPADAAKITPEALKALLKDPVVVNAVDQWQLIHKIGAANIGTFAKADAKNAEFLGWVLRNTEAMNLYLEGAAPTKLSDREANNYSLPVSSLEIWKKIFEADADSKEGLYLKLAIATAISPPGTGNRGAGQAEKPAEPLARYKHFKSAHKNGELFPSFNTHSVWELRQVVSSNASDEDLGWAREMINSWRPDLRIKEQVVASTSEVWRRNSPIPHAGTFKNVLSGGGKCGPRSSWAVFICQAFGIPCVGVGQPAHACAAYRATFPSVEPQPGYAWKVVQGRGWAVSRLPDGMSGQDFLDATAQRLRPDEFSQVEHLRWIASALASKETAASVMTVAHAIQKASAEAAAKEVRTDPPAEAYKLPAPPEEPPFPAKPGVIHIEAESFAKMDGAHVLDCYTGGKQVNFFKSVENSWTEYAVDVPAAGAYGVTMRVAAVNEDQVLNLKAGDDTNILAVVKVPQSHGRWVTTEAVDLKLEKGSQTLKVSAPFQRGVALRWLELKSK